MGVVVTVMNMKGGVGKTTITMHLAGIYSRYKLDGQPRLKVLLIDYDPQFNLSQSFIPAETYFDLEKKRKTIISVLLEDDTDINPYRLQVANNSNPPSVRSLAYNIYRPSEGGVLDIIPSTLDLMYVALGQSNHDNIIEERFRKFIIECKETYDLILVDCHPAGSILTRTSLINSDHVLIPVSPQRYATRGIGLMMQFIGAKKQGSVGPIPHILFNSVPRTGTAREEADIRGNPRFVRKCMVSTLKYYTIFSQPFEGRGFVWISGRPYSTKAFYNLLEVAREFKTRIYT